MVISGAALDGYHARAGAELVAAGALDADGFEPVAVSQADHDDGVVSLAWDGDARQHAYFSPAAGMVAVEDHALRRLCVRSSWLLDWLARELGIAGAVRPVELVPNHLWDLGDVWLGKRKSEQRRTAMYVGRRFGEPGTMLRTRTALQSRAGRPPGIILTSSPGGLRRTSPESTRRPYYRSSSVRRQAPRSSTWTSRSSAPLPMACDRCDLDLRFRWTQSFGWCASAIESSAFAAISSGRWSSISMAHGSGARGASASLS
jgi:hypothetical protein